MNARNVTWDQYTRGLRRLNTRLAVIIVAMIPLPAILLHARFEPPVMLVAVVAIAVGVGIVYPVWWRSKNHPLREDTCERRTRLIVLACRTAAFVSLVGSMASWVVGSEVSSWIALVFLAGGAAAFIVGFEVEERWKRAMRRQAARSGGDA